MRRVVAQARKELTQICRDWRTLALALVLPLVLLLLMSVSLSLTVNNLPIIVQDFDDSPASRDFVDAIRASISLNVVSWPIDRPPEEALSSNAARAVLIIPPHFGRDMARGVNSPVQLLLDASDANTAKTHGGLCQRNYACLQSTHRWHSRHHAGPNRDSASGTTQDSPPRNFTVQGSSCWDSRCSLLCWPLSPWQKNRS
jgi:hypothetical protein